MKGSRKFILVSCIVVISVIGGFITTFIWFFNALEENINQRISLELNEIGDLSEKIVETKVEDSFRELESIAAFLSYSKNIHAQEITTYLKDYQQTGTNGILCIITEKGILYGSDGETTDVFQQHYFQEALKGNRAISDVMYMDKEESPVIVMAVPIRKKDKVIGVLSNTYKTHIFKELLGEQIFDSDGKAYLVEKDGTIVTGYDDFLGSDNLYSYIEDAQLENAVSVNAFVSSIKNDHTNLLIYHKNGLKFYLRYTPLNVNNWYLILNISADSQGFYINQFSNTGFKMVGYIFILFIILVVFLLLVLLVTTRRMKKSHQELLAKSDELIASEKRFRIISEQSHDILYEFNLETHQLYVSPIFKKKFGYELTYNNIKNCLSLHPEDSNKFRDMIKRVYNKSNYGVCEVRLRHLNGKYIWCSLHNTLVMKNDKKVSKIIGKIVDIDKRKKDIENLTELSKRDPLTKVYNKVTIQEMIEDYFKCEGKNSRHAFIFIDIDNFKAINDNLGHSFGDSVLTELSASLKEIYAGNNFIGRIGGDEFVALLKDIDSTDVVIEKAEEICSLLRNTYTGENNDYSVSASIGIALYPDDGSDYHELYTKADEALYEAKSAGKNQFIIYGTDPVGIHLINIGHG